MKKLFVAALILMAVQVNAGTTIEVEPGEVFTVKGVYSGFVSVIDGPEYDESTSLTANIVASGTNTTIRKTCSKDDLHKLLYQARQHLPKRQGESMATVTTLQSFFEKESSRLRREARELDAYDEWLDIVDKAADEDECD